MPDQPHPSPFQSREQTAAVAADRRSAARRPTRLPGWFYEAGRCHEVVMSDVSSDGAAFAMTRRPAEDRFTALKIGMGPLRRPRPCRVIHVTDRGDGTYVVGVRFRPDGE